MTSGAARTVVWALSMSAKKHAIACSRAVSVQAGAAVRSWRAVVPMTTTTTTTPASSLMRMSVGGSVGVRMFGSEYGHDHIINSTHA